MVFDIKDLTHPHMRMLAYAVVEPQLRSILVLDASFGQLLMIDEILGAMLVKIGEHSTGTLPPPRILAAYDDEDRLWGAMTLKSHAQSSPFVWQNGIISSERDQPLRRLIIPDLSRSNLSVARACVATAGADVVHVERHGNQITNEPRILWLTACARTDLGKVSNHLLDRFAFRIPVVGFPSFSSPGYSSQLRISRLRNELYSSNDRHAFKDLVIIGDDLSVLLGDAVQYSPRLTETALTRLASFNVPGGVGVRRLLTLARMAIAEARLSRESRVEQAHVDQAARLFGFDVQGKKGRAPKDNWPPKDSPEAPGSANTDGPPSGSGSHGVETGELGGTQSLSAPDTTTELPLQMLDTPVHERFGEDQSTPQRPIDSLRLPAFHKGSHSYLRGLAVGVEQARSLRDLSLSATIFEAAKNRHWRTNNRPNENSLTIRVTDLRTYRRSPAPDEALVLIVDYTALRHDGWSESLLPFLQWAYVERTSVHLIRVGARDAADELRAQRDSFRNILAPNFVMLLLASEAGRATPLAHGLVLAKETILRLQQTGRIGFYEAQLVVLSDGRGNVPLGEDLGRSSGVTDAIEVAKELALMKRVKTYMIDLKPPHRPAFQVMLADALGATLIS